MHFEMKLCCVRKICSKMVLGCVRYALGSVRPQDYQRQLSVPEKGAKPSSGYRVEWKRKLRSNGHDFLVRPPKQST